MTYFTETTKARLEEIGEADLSEALLSTYEDLQGRRLPHVDYPEDGRTNTIARLKFNCKACQQVLLHRALRLFDGALSAFADTNVYALALCVRAHFETVATLGYLHKRLMSCVQGTIPVSAFDEDIFTQMVGCRHKSLAKTPNPKSIMKQLDYADEVVDRDLLAKHGASPRGILRDDYEFLSEFCHPNFHSNTLAFEVDNKKHRFVFRYDTEFRRAECYLVGYLDISNPVFVWFFDEFGKMIPMIPTGRNV